MDPLRATLTGRLHAVSGHSNFDETLIVRLAGPNQFPHQQLLADLARRQRTVVITIEEVPSPEDLEAARAREIPEVNLDDITFAEPVPAGSHSWRR